MKWNVENTNEVSLYVFDFLILVLYFTMIYNLFIRAYFIATCRRRSLTNSTVCSFGPGMNASAHLVPGWREWNPVHLQSSFGQMALQRRRGCRRHRHLLRHQRLLPEPPSRRSLSPRSPPGWLSVWASSSQRCSRTGGSECGTGFWIVAGGTCSQGLPRISGLGSSLDTVRIRRGTPTK